MRYCYQAVPLTAICLLTRQRALGQNTFPYWSLPEKSNVTSSSTKKLDPTNAYALRLATNNILWLYISPNAGYVVIGTSSHSKKLHVVGTSLFTANLTLTNGGLVTTNTTGNGVLGIGNPTSVFGISDYQTGVYGIVAIYGVYGSSVTGRKVCWNKEDGRGA
jgi:hypothetical protein